MKRLVLALLALVAIAAVVAAGGYAFDRAFPGHRNVRAAAAPTVSESRTLAPFARIDVDGMVDVTLVQGAEEAVRIETPAKQRSRVRAEVRDGTLAIEGAPADDWFGGIFGGGSRSARVVVTFRTLERVRGSGAVTLKADGIKADSLGIALTGASSVAIGRLDAKSLAVSGSGAMKAEIAGRAAEQTVEISGAGAYRAGDFVTDATTVSVSGAGKAIVNAARTLDVRISGAGAVDYYGNPKVHEDVSGAGRVRRRDSASVAAAVAG